MATAIAFGLIAALHLRLSDDKSVHRMDDGAIVIFAERWLIFDDPSLLCLIAIFEDKEFFNSFAKVACHTKNKDC